MVPSSRPVTPADEAFLFTLFVTARADEPGGGVLPEPLVRMQFVAQRASQRARHPDGEHFVLLRGRERIGAVFVAREAHEIRLVDIALLPARRGAGVGTGVVRALQEEARRGALPLRLSVALGNRAARRLYARLGFLARRTSATHADLEWRAVP